MNDQDLKALFQASQAQSRRQGAVDWRCRQDRLKRLETLLSHEENILLEAIISDFGYRAREEIQLAEVFSAKQGLRHSLRHTRRWMKPKRVHTDMTFWPASSWIIPQPKGVAGIIAPWNYPLLLSLAPAMAALSAGCTVMLKPSEQAPAFAQALQEAIRKYFNTNEFCVVVGDAKLAATFAALPFDHLLFTGSPEIGKKVMAAAAQNLTPVTLELGGKSPVIILDDADLNYAAERIMFGKLMNAGQTCVAPDHVYVPQAKVTAFVQAALSAITRCYPDLNQDYGRIINHHHFDRLMHYLDEAQAAGASLIYAANQAPNRNLRLMPPVLVLNCPMDVRLMQEEIFGPILPIISYDNANAILQIPGNHSRPLAAYLFSNNRQQQQKWLNHNLMGGVTINDTILHLAQDNLPFGGVGMSGMGAYHGYAGFATFSHFMSVFRQNRCNLTRLIHPPYGRLFHNMMSWLLR